MNEFPLFPFFIVLSSDGIPLYRANSDGLTRAMQRFLTERSSEADDAQQEVGRWHGVPANTGSNLAAYVESLLGDALAWAQACVMIQPVSNGMADALRRKFQNHLPPERIERLYRLPGASWNVSGLRFSLPVLAILRHGFTIRWSAEEQRAILEFIIEQIKLLEPEEKDSLSHLSWEWSLERVRLELDPDAALRRLAQIFELDAYKNSIKNEFSKLVLPDAADANADRIPLRIRPLTQDGLDKFGKLSGQKVSRNDFWESLKAIRHRFAEAMRRIRQITEFLLKTARKLPDKLFGTPAAPHVIIAEPAELRFRSLRTGESNTQTLMLKRTDGAGLSGRIVTDAVWLRIHKSLCDNLHPQHTTPVTADTGGLETGNHSAVITFVSADGTPPLEVEVSARVVRSWLDAFADWWRENRPSSAMRVALLGLFIGLIALAAAEYALPRNWLNALYNNAPELVGRLEHDLTDAQNLRLTAKVKDADGDNLQDSRWEVDLRPPTAKTEIQRENVLPSGNHSETIERMLSNLNLNDLPVAFRIKVFLSDARGGQSIYEMTLDLKKEFNPRFAPNQIPITSPVNANNNQPKDANKNSKDANQKANSNGNIILIPNLGNLANTSETLTVKNLRTEYINNAQIYWQNSNYTDGYSLIVRGLEYYESLSDIQKKLVLKDDIYLLEQLEVVWAYQLFSDEPRWTEITFNDKNYSATILRADISLDYYNLFRSQMKEKYASAAKRLREMRNESYKQIADSKTPTPTPLIVIMPTPNPSETPTPTITPTQTPELTNRPIRVTKNDNPTTGLTGKEIIVKVRVTVNERGAITDIDIVGNDSRYSGEAKNRVKMKWRFEPAMKDGKLIEDKIVVDVIFKPPTQN